MRKKNNNRKFEDKTHKRVTRSNDRRKTKSDRHQTKDFIHGIGTSSLDNDNLDDIIDELENTEWSD